MRHKGERDPMERRIRLKSLNRCIVCALCRGYLVEATTITECLHTFCKSCIVRHLQKNVTCPYPTCGITIHQSHPLNYISHDRTMQDIVYKLVPDLQQDEMERQKKFYKSMGMEVPKNIVNGQENGRLTPDVTENNNKDIGADKDYHRGDEQVNVCLECSSQHNNQLKMLKRKYIRCSTQATITHLKKYVALKLYKNTDKFKSVEILCNDEILGKDHTLKFICVTRWRAKEKPLHLTYRPSSRSIVL